MEKQKRNQLTFKLNKDTHFRLKIQALKEERTIAQILNDLVEQYLDEKGA